MLLAVDSLGLYGETAGKLYELEVKYLVGGVARSMLGAQHVTD